MRRLFWINYFDRYVTSALRTRSHRILRLWSEHCEYIIAQRFRRTQQAIYLYRRLWDDRAFRSLLQQLRKQVSGQPTCTHTCVHHSGGPWQLWPSLLIVIYSIINIFVCVLWFCVVFTLTVSYRRVMFIPSETVENFLISQYKWKKKLRCALFYVTPLIRINTIR